jgi:tetratricopeptide (TPR) repeat protein
MESGRTLDSASRSRSERTLKYAFIHRPLRFKAQIRTQRLKRRLGVLRGAIALAGLLCPVLLGPVLLSAQSASIRRASAPEIEQLVTEQRWDDVVRLVGREHSPSADMDFYYGTALAHLGRFRDAEAALEAGHRLVPGDPRFYVELAGVAFKQKRYPQAANYLQRAVKLVPADSYSNDFLGTVYFIEGNLPAALKYWNRVNKPEIAESAKIRNPASRLHCWITPLHFRLQAR